MIWLVEGKSSVRIVSSIQHISDRNANFPYRDRHEITHSRLALMTRYSTVEKINVKGVNDTDLAHPVESILRSM